ncbi:MAG: BamA/TamA family outer membrane protein [Bacteroidota bacterium]|jgi:outer membrane protein assembly factor BamA
MKHIFLLILVYGIRLSFLSAQENANEFGFPDSTYRVSEIIVVGNETTKSYVIENEMSLAVGNTVTYDAVRYDRERIYNLRLFTKVDIDVVPTSADEASVIVRVNERWYFYPYPVVGLKDRSLNKIYYGAGLIHNNVGGRNVLLYGQFAAGYDPFISFGYVDPLFGFDHKIFFSMHLSFSEQRNRSLVSLKNGPNFDERRWGWDVSLGKRYSLFSTVTTTLEYLNLHVSDNRAGRTLSPNGHDHFFSFAAAYRYDTRDLADYPRIGTFFSASVSKIGIFDNVVDYERYNLDIRRYIPIVFDMVAAGRMFTSIAGGGAIPNYGHTFFGYADRIRGYFSKILEGEQIAGSTVELHVPLIKSNYIRIDQIPIEQFRDIRYEMNLAFFADAGSTWYRKEAVALNKFYSGYGVGIHLNLAYSAVGRIEYAIPYGNPLSKGEIIFDIGAAL